MLYVHRKSISATLSKFVVIYIHLTDDTSISQQLKYPDQLDPEDVTTPASLHVLQSKDRYSFSSMCCHLLNTELDPSVVL